MSFINSSDLNGTFLGRVWRPDVSGPSIVTLRAGKVVDITSREAPTVRDICELEDPAGYVSSANGEVLGLLSEIAEAQTGDQSAIHFLAPCDLQSVKACGVT
ncbi:MAG: fumarylacetoacetate hydrolase, partial [Pseudomonadota bacterium]